MTKDSRISVSSLLLLLAIFLLLGYQLSKWTAKLFRSPAVEERVVTARGDLAEDEKTTIALFKNASPSVVYITTVAERVDFRTLNVLQVPQGTGSGFVWDDAGNIVTNYHVVAVAGATGANVTLANHKTYPATNLWASAEDDLAVLRINAPREELIPIAIGTSSDLQVGQRVFAIGDPFGLDQTLTTGILSAVGRTVPSEHPIFNALQTDAAINPGNSGGPLLDSAGRLIGINTAIVGATNAGIGFAIPVDTVNRIVSQLIANGKVVRPDSGIRTSEVVSRQVLGRAGITGVLVLAIEPGSPAEKAGLRPTRRLRNGDIEWGDVVLTVGRTHVNSIEDLNRAFEAYKPGQKVPLTILRGGKQQTVELEPVAPSR